MTTIRYAAFPADREAVLGIWRAFIANAGVNLDYQNNEAEFATLPGKFARPGGCVLLADQDGAIDRCIALRRVSAEICEMKWLYVRPVARGRGLGRALVERAIAEARAVGYSEMRLDVMAEFAAARALYEHLGFVAAEPVAFDPRAGASFLGRRL